MMDEKLWIRALMDEGSYVPFVNERAGVTGGMGLMDGRPVCCMRAGETNDPSGADAALCALLAQVSRLAMPVILLEAQGSLPGACRELSRLSGVCPLICVQSADTHPLTAALCDVRVGWGDANMRASCTDICAADEPDALETVRNLLSLLPGSCAEDAPLLGAQTAAEPVRAGDCLPLALHACADAGAELPLYAGTQGEAFLCRINGRVCVCAAVSGDVPPPGLTRLMRMGDAFSLLLILALAGELPHDPALYYALSAATTVKLCVSDAAQPPLFDWTLAGTDRLRGRMAAALEVLASKRDVLLPRKHGNMPL